MKSSLGDVGNILELRQSFADRLRNFKTYENLQEPLKNVGFTHRVELNPMVSPLQRLLRGIKNDIGTRKFSEKLEHTT
jgi:hypothetical protein